MIVRLVNQLRTRSRMLTVLYLPAFLLLAGAVGLSVVAGVPLGKLTRDPAAITGRNPFLGALSNLGILLWCATAAITLFTFVVLRARGMRGKAASLFLTAGLFTLILLFDDLFLFHENLAGRYLSLDESVIFVVYGAMLFGFLVRFRRSILETDFALLLLALGLFALSMLIDKLQPLGIVPARHLFEDGFKFLGIVTWLGYFTSVALSALLRPSAESTPPDFLHGRD